MVSVIIPTHNRANLLARAIRSVQNQTWRDLEIIVVSDGVDSATEKIVEELASKDTRIRYVDYSPAKGGNFARNLGIDCAMGDFIAFLDDDDEFFPDKIANQISVMQSDMDIGLVYTGVHIIYESEKVHYTSIRKASGNLNRAILLDNIIGTTSTVMVRKSILQKSGGFDTELRALQDYDLWIRICQLCKVGCVNQEQINYYNYSGAKQISSFTEKYRDAFTYINMKYANLFQVLTPEEKRQKKYNEYMLLGNKSMRNGDKSLARKMLKNALREKVAPKALLYYILSFTSFKILLKIRRLF